MKIPVVPGIFLLSCWRVLATPSLAPPKLRLDASVQPLRYAVDLTIVPDRDTFRGIIDIEVNVQTPSTIIWLNSIGLAIEGAGFRPQTGTALSAKTEPGGDQFTGFLFDHGIAGKGTLHIAYQGKISRRSTAGIFGLREDRDWYVYSRFEPTNARRAFPCFDEPGFKVPWQLTLHVPKGEMALSNTPVQSESSEPHGMKAVRFKVSPPLPSYLIALAVGPFDAIDAGNVGSTPVRVIVPRGKTTAAAYAVTAIPQLLKLLEDYLGAPFPYEKLDSVVTPISDFETESAGLISYAESALLASPAFETIAYKRVLAGICAHEMAHQWFGDLVTPKWWNDTWLSEAFAIWMERKIPNAWHPEWHLNGAIVKARLGAMRHDRLVSARAVRLPIESNDGIAEAFDRATYEKGAAVIEMFERWLNPERFRVGVQLYLKQHAWGNAVADDFESAMSTVAGKDLAPAFSSFLDQPGVPEILASLKCEETPKLEMVQKQSLPLDSRAKPQIWKIPICVAYQAGVGVEEECSMIASATTDIELDEAQACPAWLLPNDEEIGYYQVAYQGDLLKRVLAEGGSRLTVGERVGVLGELESLAGTGDIPAGAALTLVPAFSKDPAPQVVQAAANIASLLNGEIVPIALRPKAARFVRQEFGDQAKALGWLAKPGDADDARLLRQQLIPFVASAGEQKELIEEAEKLAPAWLKSRHTMTPEMLGPLLQTAAEFGNLELFNLLRTAASQERDRSLRKELLRALGSFRKPELAAAAMDLLLSKDFDPRESFYPLLFGPLAYAETRDVPFEFVTRHLSQLLNRLPRETGHDYAAALPVVGRAFCDANRRDQLDVFFRERVKDYAGGPLTLTQTLEGIDICIATRQALVTELTAFLNQH